MYDIEELICEKFWYNIVELICNKVSKICLIIPKPIYNIKSLL